MMPAGLMPVSYLEKQMLNLASVMQANSGMDFAVLFSSIERQFTVTLRACYELCCVSAKSQVEFADVPQALPDRCQR